MNYRTSSIPRWWYGGQALEILGFWLKCYGYLSVGPRGIFASIGQALGRCWSATRHAERSEAFAVSRRKRI